MSPSPQGDVLPPELKPIATFAARHFLDKGEWPLVREVLRMNLGLGGVAEVEQRIQRLFQLVYGMTVGLTPGLDNKVAVDIAVMAQLDLAQARQFALDYVEFIKICAQRYNEPQAELKLTSIELLMTLLRRAPNNERQGWLNTFVQRLYPFLQSNVERPGIWGPMGSTNNYEWNMDIGDMIRYFLSVHTLPEYLAERKKVLGQYRQQTVEAIMQAAQPQTLGPVHTVFLVHGHDLDRRNHVRLALEKMGYKVVVLSEQAYGGRHTLTKFREEADKAQFAVILVTGDDLAVAKREIETTSNSKSVAKSKLRGRARQNVIFEWGYFIHKFGTKGVCALVEPNVEILSDLDGLGRVDLKPGWEEHLKAEIEKANQDEDA